jgi:hypothetical protein
LEAEEAKACALLGEETEMIGPERRKELSNRLLEHLEAALAVTDELEDAVTGFLIERALDQARANIWPGNLDLPPQSKLTAAIQEA